MKPRVLVSQCLLGLHCRYSGEGVVEPSVCREACERGWIPVCPEVLGGLSTPRPPAERKDGRVVNDQGGDVTDEFRRGAEETLRLAKLYGAKYALLKERSPSCGAGVIYDGTFSHTRIPGDGMTAGLLKAEGIEVFGESQLEELLKKLEDAEK